MCVGSPSVARNTRPVAPGFRNNARRVNETLSTMPLVTTYRVKAYLTAAGHRLLDQRLEEQRLLYNGALEERLTAWRMGRVSLGRPHQSRELTAIRAEMPEYAETHRRVSVGTLDRLDRAYGRFTQSLAELGKVRAGQLVGSPKLLRWDARENRWAAMCGRPRFKSAERFRTLECHAGAERFLRRSESGRKGFIRIKGLPRLHIRWDSRLPVASDGQPVQPLSVKVTRTPKRVTVSMSFAIGDAPETSSTTPLNPVGLHPGVVQRLTASTVPAHLVMDRRSRDRRVSTRLQRKMARQRRQAIGKGIASWQRTATGRYRMRWHPLDPDTQQSGQYGRSYRKTRRQLSRHEQTTTEADMGLLHEISSKLVKEHDAICIEAPNIGSMTQSASGDLESPGKGVSRQQNLNRSILEQTWGRFADMLEYKAERAGIPFARVPSPYMSQTCHQCGVTDPASRRSRAHFRCAHCGFNGDAEENAARNVLVQGLALLGLDAGGTLPQWRSARLSTAGIPAVAAENRAAHSGFT